ICNVTAFSNFAGQVHYFGVRNESSHAERATCSGLIIVKADVNIRDGFKLLGPFFFKSFRAACGCYGPKRVRLQNKTVELPLADYNLCRIVGEIFPAVEFQMSFWPSDHFRTFVFIFRVFGLLEENDLSVTVENWNCNSPAVPTDEI